MVADDGCGDKEGQEDPYQYLNSRCIGTRMPSPLIHKGFVFVAVPTAIRERVSRTVIDAVASPLSDTALASLGSGTCAAVPFETCALVVRVYLCQNLA